MKKSIILILSTILFLSCSNIPTHEQQYNKISPNIFFTKIKAEGFAKLANIFTDTAKKTRGFEKQVSALENPYIEAAMDFNTFIYNELFYFDNFNSAQSYILDVKMEIMRNKNKLFKNNAIHVNEYGVGIDKEIIIIFDIQKMIDIFSDKYVVMVYAQYQKH